MPKTLNEEWEKELDLLLGIAPPGHISRTKVMFEGLPSRNLS